MTDQSVLATLPGSTPRRRLQVVLVLRDDGRPVLNLREQHHAAGIGWFDQRSLELEPHQVRRIRGLFHRDGGFRPGVAPRRPRPDGPGEEPIQPYRIFRGPASDPPAHRVEDGGVKRIE